MTLEIVASERRDAVKNSSTTPPSVLKMLQQVAPGVCVPQRASHELRGKPLALRGNIKPSEDSFSCPRCLRRIDGIKLRDHLRFCIRQHLTDLRRHETTPISHTVADDVEPLLSLHGVLCEVAASRSADVDESCIHLGHIVPPNNSKMCPLCTVIIDRQSFAAHLDICPENKRSCTYCFSGVSVAEWDNHLRSCPMNCTECYICGLTVQFASMAAHVAQQCKQNNRVITMYHGTDLESARSIFRSGFKPSEKGLLGEGVYLSRDVTKASKYGPVIIEAQVDVGRVCVIDRKDHPLQKTWRTKGYNSAWIPPGSDASKSKHEEHCVYDVRRVVVISVNSDELNSTHERHR